MLLDPFHVHMRNAIFKVDFSLRYKVVLFIKILQVCLCRQNYFLCAKMLFDDSNCILHQDMTKLLLAMRLRYNHPAN